MCCVAGFCKTLVGAKADIWKELFCGLHKDVDGGCNAGAWELPHVLHNAL